MKKMTKSMFSRISETIIQLEIFVKTSYNHISRPWVLIPNLIVVRTSIKKKELYLWELISVIKAIIKETLIVLVSQQLIPCGKKP